MNLNELSQAALYAFWAGQQSERAWANIKRARDETYTETKRLLVNWARADHHAALKYLRLSREAV